jgi:hypothetical protein
MYLLTRHHDTVLVMHNDGRVARTIPEARVVAEVADPDTGSYLATYLTAVSTANRLSEHARAMAHLHTYLKTLPTDVSDRV